MSRSSSQLRNLPTLTTGDPLVSTYTYDDIPPGTRKQSLPASPSPHGRKPSLDARPYVSTMSRDASPHTHSRIPSLQTIQPYLDSPGLNTGRTVTQGQFQSNSRPPSRGRMGPADFTPPDELLPPPPIGASYSDRMSSPTGSRASSLSRGGRDSLTLSSDAGSRAASPSRPVTPSSKLNKKKWGLPGKHSRNASSARNEPPYFIAGRLDKPEYDISGFLNRQPVPELWDEQGDLYVHLFGESQGPSFRLPSNIIESSRAFQRLLAATERSPQDGVTNIDQHMRKISLGSNLQRVPSAGIARHLYIPMQFSAELRREDIENLVAIRNLFAFLIAQVLVGSSKQNTLYAVFKNVAGLLAFYDFTNDDGSTYGEIPKHNFWGYIEDLQINDVRSDRVKTLEAIVLGEMMKYWPLYNEGYVHCVGKWKDLCSIADDTMDFITQTTRKRMEKSHMDLNARRHTAELTLNDFEFPSLFQGIAASSAFQKAIDVKAWRSSWVSMRRFTMTFYKNRYGAWPPKASSKKNDFEESGLNRIVLRELYKDFCDLYDMLVDKSNLTTRTADQAAHDEILAEKLQLHWLRQLMSEFDRSSPPVKPPIPYDLCRLPNLKLVSRDYDALPEKKQAKERSRKLKSDQINLVLIQSYDRDSMQATQFLEAFMAYERGVCQGKSIGEIVDLRIGQWIFLYVVLQSLPMLAVDAPDLRYTEGVEYFLCEVPSGSPPWIREDTNGRRMYRGADGSAYQYMQTETVQHSTDAIYERSHCWEMAKIWSHGLAKMPIQPAIVPGAKPVSSSHIPSVVQPDLNPQYSALPAVPPIGQPWRSSSANSSPRSSVALHLDVNELPPPPSIRTDGGGGLHARKVSTPDARKTFDEILGSAVTPSGKKKSGWGSFSG